MTPLRMQMTEDMRAAGLAAGTQRIYLDGVRRLAEHYRRGPDRLSEAEVRTYLLGLRERGVALGTFKTNHGGIQFLYRRTLERDWPLFGGKKDTPPKQRRLPVALPDADVRKLLGCVSNPRHKSCLTLMYACGLRISEATTLEIGKIDGANRLLRIIGKGDKQRLVPLPAPILDELRGLWRSHRHPRWLFPNRDGANPVSAYVLGRTLQKVRWRIGPSVRRYLLLVLLGLVTSNIRLQTKPIRKPQRLLSFQLNKDLAVASLNLYLLGGGREALRD